MEHEGDLQESACTPWRGRFKGAFWHGAAAILGELRRGFDTNVRVGSGQAGVLFADSWRAPSRRATECLSNPRTQRSNGSARRPLVLAAKDG